MHVRAQAPMHNRSGHDTDDENVVKARRRVLSGVHMRCVRTRMGECAHMSTRTRAAHTQALTFDNIYPSETHMSSEVRACVLAACVYSQTT